MNAARWWTLCFLAVSVGAPIAAWRESSRRSVDSTPSALFEKVWTAGDGVGPLANAQSCAACHNAPHPGGSGVERETFVLFSPSETDETGGHLFRQLLIRPGRAVVRRGLPQTVVTRRPPSLLGLGILERVSAADRDAVADPDDRDRDGVSGRRPANGGRFGWKARFATVREAVAAALVGELGLTNPVFGGSSAGAPRAHPEVTESELTVLTAFVRGLPPLDSDRVSGPGGATFASIGCGKCHLSSGDSPLARAYTDLLLHDMGAALADGLSEGDAGGREFRTTPLWGLGRTGPPYLHDGRARTLDAAIRAHDGEASSARARYAALRPAERRRLLEFLRGL